MKQTQLNTYDGKPSNRYNGRSAELVSVALALTTFSANGDQKQATNFSCSANCFDRFNCSEQYTTSRSINGWPKPIQLQG